MRSILFGLLPGSVFLYRYNPNLFFAKTVGLALMEVVPYLLLAFVEEKPMLGVLLGFLLLYSVYDIGYVHNDYVSARELRGRTDRMYLHSFCVRAFLVARLFVLCWLLMCLMEGHDNVGLISLSMFGILVVFFVHNFIRNPESRIVTFIMLNSFKVLFRFFCLQAPLTYFLATIPHCFVKLIHYFGAKEIINVESEAFSRISLYVYVGFMLVIVFVDIRLFVLCAPYFINHNKRFLMALILRRPIRGDE